MKKFKKMLAGLLGAAMVLTSFGTPAWADSATKTNLPTIDTNKTGTLTINKYEGTDTSKPLADVEFTIWKVADIDQDTSVASKVGFKYTPVTGLGLDENDFTSDQTEAQKYTSDIYNKVLTKLNKNKDVENGKLAGGKTATTVLDKDTKIASAKFEDLELGLYLVQETKAPSQIVNKTANFLVSVPMTNEAGTAWNYDVVANPKNEAVYSGITLKKTGTTISADGTKTKPVLLGGVTFQLQKRAHGSKEQWTKVGEYTTSNTTGNDFGTFHVDSLAPNDYRFIETSLGTSDTNNGYILNGNPYEFTVTDEGKIKVGSAGASEGAMITADNEKPDLKKEVKKGDTYANAADASIGDMVEWKVSASVPSNVDQLKEYSITDTMSNALTWVEAEAALNITYKFNGTPVNAETTDYKLIKPTDNQEGGSWTIKFTDAGKMKLKTNNISLIEVTFKTKLNENAKIGINGNLNDAQLDYSNAIYPSVDPNPNDGKKPGVDHIKDQAIVYSFSIDVTKVDGNNNATKLKGVHFDLYKYSGSVESPTESELKGAEGTKIKTDLVTDDKGKITVKGLKNGNYYLVETKAAAGGYNLLKAPVKVVIAQDYSVEKKTTVTKDKEGNVTSTTTVVNKTFKGEDENNAGTYSVTIENRKGFTLPITGDIGTAMFLIIGIGGMLAAVYIMLRGRKRA